MRRATKNVTKTTHTVAPFDLKTVKTEADNPIRTGKRIFGIQEAPIFYPTLQEFKDPLAYIEKISPEGEKYGIIKIVPPKGYKPEFCLKTETFHFKTRIQKLNSMEGETRTNVNYLDQLSKYHILTGKPVGKIPQLDKRPIDLYKLKNEVAIRGGVQQVTRLKKWAEIGRALGYSRKQCTSMSNALKTAYSKVILPYEVWYAKHKDVAEKVIKKEDADANVDICKICQQNENNEKLLLCDGCDRSYHIYCLSPALDQIPENDWYCIHCLTAVGKDYGFEDGGEYTLEEFQRFSDNFKKQWFLEKLGKDKPVTEEECENEFWRLVENPYETCKVEYGADLHSTQHGSGFMAPEQMSKDNKFDPWNLNVISVAPQSLFTHIKTDISGMMIPWLYVGMCFSAFCWHNEDHYTYSINYMHWGETKTWYGIPGSDTAKFEETMKKAVPELFEQQPDLLFQLVTMLSPGRLLKENVNVYAVDQRPGQFVVTYPKAYHSGFNHGFNFCEAVNFAPGEWMQNGLECVKRYKAFRKQPCFSHDELVITAAQNITSTKNINWLKQALTELETRELSERSQVRTHNINEQVILDNTVHQELQCDHCHCYSFLSYIGCKCTQKIACLDHISELCTCAISSKTLYLRFTDKQLKEITKKICESDSIKWLEKLDKTMASKPSLKTLKELLKEGLDINAPQESLDTLKDYIDTVDEWNTEAEKALNLDNDHFKHEQKKRSEKVKELIQKASLIGADVSYMDELKAYNVKLEDFNRKLTDEVLTNADLRMQCYNEGLQLCADSPQFYQLCNMIESSSWEERVEHALNTTFNAKNMRKLIKEGQEINKQSALLNRLIDVEEFGKQVLLHIENICKGKEKIELDEQESLLNIEHNGKFSIKIDPQIIARLKINLTKSQNTIHEIENILNYQSANSSVLKRPPITEAHRLMSLCREVCFKSDLISILSDEITKVTAWNEQLKITFMNGRQKSLETVLEETLSNVQRITSSKEKPGTWCICRKLESGLMIECDVCREWYHSHCLKLSRNAVRKSKPFVCPICSCSRSATKMLHVSRQPKLEEITDLVVKGEALKFQPADYSIVFDIHKIMQDYRNNVQRFYRSRSQLNIQDIPMMKHYLRILLGLEVFLKEETEFFLSEIQNIMPISEIETRTKSLDSRDQQLPRSMACPCQNSERKNNTIICSSCNDWFHTDCVQSYYNHPLKMDQFKCMNCYRTTPESSTSLLLVSVPGLKRSAEHNLSLQPQKILKLTVNPPAQPMNHRKQQNYASEGAQTTTSSSNKNISL